MSPSLTLRRRFSSSLASDSMSIMAASVPRSAMSRRAEIYGSGDAQFPAKQLNGLAKQQSLDHLELLARLTTWRGASDAAAAGFFPPGPRRRHQKLAQLVCLIYLKSLRYWRFNRNRISQSSVRQSNRTAASA